MTHWCWHIWNLQWLTFVSSALFKKKKTWTTLTLGAPRLKHGRKVVGLWYMYEWHEDFTHFKGKGEGWETEKTVEICNKKRRPTSGGWSTSCVFCLLRFEDVWLALVDPLLCAASFRMVIWRNRCTASDIQRTGISWGGGVFRMRRALPGPRTNSSS